MTTTHRYLINIFTLTGSVVAIAMGYFIIVSNTKVDFNINWNMFESILMWPLYIIGFILGLGQKFQVYEAVIKTEYSDGRVKYERNDDVVESMMAGCVLPLLNYFVFYPLAFAAIIYYGVMLLIYLFGVIFPYLVCAFILFSLFLLYKIESKFSLKENGVIWMTLCAILFILFYWGLYVFWADSYDENRILALYLNWGAVFVCLPVMIGALVKQSSGMDEAQAVRIFNKSRISRPFLISFIISFFVVIGVYGFKGVSEYPSMKIAQSSIPAKKTPTKETKTSSKTVTSSESTSTLTNNKKKTSSVSSSPEVMNINKRTGALTSLDVPYDIHYSAQRFSVHDRHKMKIDKIPAVSEALNNELCKRTLIYEGKNGRLESFVHIIKDNATHEYLIAYDSQGNYISDLPIGFIHAYGGDRRYGEISGDKITTYYTYPESDEILCTLYKITPNLKFVKEKEYTIRP